MKTLDIVLLCIQVAVILVTAYVVAIRPPSAPRPRPIYSSLMVSLLVISMVSFNIADRHEGSLGAELVQFGAAVVLGLGLAMGMLAFRAMREGRSAGG